MMKPEAILLHDSRLTPEDACLERLIKFLGLSCRNVDSSAVDAELDRAEDHELYILTNAVTVAKWCRDSPTPASALDRLRYKSSSVFIYGFTPHTPNFIADSLSGGALTAVRGFARTDLRYEVTSARPEITREFSGLSFTCARHNTDFGFAWSPGFRGLTSLVTVEGMPFWALVEHNHCKTFLLACNAISDIREQANGNVDATKHFSRLLPAAMFLRSEFENRCWHSKLRFASFIIDDPLLKRSYGFLNYRNLVSTMDKESFATTIAFIPGNYKRTHNEVTQLFRKRPDRLSLCVHGCDHTTAEFSTTNVAVLNSRVQLATARMDSLYRHHGLPYSTAMVFPQGRFSPEALRALQSNNYLAAVNSSASPENAASDRSLALADFLQPAVTRYGGFPIFLRRYPAGFEQFAFDLFFGRPALVVEHHGYLKDGGGRLAGFIAGLNSLSNLHWTGLRETITRSYLEREVSDDIAECKLYANEHVIDNHADCERAFVISKSELDDVPIETVFLNGQSADFVKNGNVLTLTARIPAFSSALVKIVYRNVLPVVEPRRAVAGRGRVWTRRMLTEIRDNFLSRNDFLLASAQSLHHRLSRRRNPAPRGQRPSQMCSLGRADTPWDCEKSERCDPRLNVREGFVDPLTPTQMKVDIPAERGLSASDVGRILGRSSKATINNVLVLGTEGSTPLKRMEIHVGNLKEIPATLNLLAVALRRSGVDFGIFQNPDMPATDIWLTSPLRDGNKTLLSCAAIVGVQAAQQVSAGAALLESHAQPNIELQQLQIGREDSLAGKHPSRASRG